MRVALIGLFISLGIGNAWADSHNTHYGKAVLKNATGHGTVYLSTASGSNSGQTNSSNPGTAGGQSWITWNCNGSESNDSKTYYARYSAAEDGWYYAGWSNNSNATSYTASTTGKTFSTSSTNSGSPTTTTIYGYFKPVTVTAAPSNVNINATDPSATYNDAAGTVVSFTTANSNKIGDFTTSESGDARWVISAWTRASASSTTFNYKFVGNGSYGTNNRTLTKTVTLTSKGDASSTKTCTLTAKYPNPKVVECNGESTDLTIYPTFKAADATQAAVEKTAVFDVVYADNANNFSAAFSGATGSGTWKVTVISVDQANQKATVTYTFNGNKSAGTHTAVLTLTANDCNGWDDTSAAGGASANVTLTAENTQEATDDATVIAADGETVIYTGDWATALSKANTAANADCTLKVLRDVSGLNANQTITNTFTLDLNGKTLTGKYGGSIIYINKAGKTLTIKDSKTGGKVQNVHNEFSGAVYCVNCAAGNLILESGTLYSENKGASGRKAVAVYNKAGTTVTVNGGKLEAQGYNATYALYQEEKKGTPVFTLNNGELVAYGYQDIYAIFGYGTVNVNSGTINATATYSNCRGITLHAVASSTASSCIYGTLNMKGGIINSTCTANADGDRLAYGIFFDCSNAGMGTATATDGSHANKAAATGTIENATINVSTLGRKSYGVMAYGSYQSKTNQYDVIQFKNTTINVTSQYYYTYGVYANVGVNGTHGACYFGNIELTDCNVSATTTKYHTAYAVYGGATYATVFKDKQPNYFGEYAVASKITINRGTYTAETGTHNAYAIVTGTRARSMYDSETSVYADRKLGGVATAYPELIINDGTFTATAKGTNGDRPARAVSSGGNTTITGGTFKAVSNGRYARAIYGVTGKLKVTGATIEAVANGKYASDNTTSEATGVFADATIQTPTGFTDYCDAEITNCDITATTEIGTGAYGVYVNCTSRPFTELYLRLDSLNNSWTHKDDGSGTYDVYKYIYPSGDRSVAAKCKVSGGKIKAESKTVGSAYGIYAAGPTMSHYGTTSAECQLIVEKGTNIDVQANTSTACAIQTAGLSSIDNVTAIAKTVTSTSAYGVYCNYNKTTITNSSFTVTGATGTAYGVYANASLASNSSATTKKIPSSATTATTIIPAYNYAFVREAEIELGEGNVFDVKTTSGNTAYAVYVHAAKADWTKAATYLNATGSYAYAAKATITGGTYKANAAGTTSYALCLAAKQTQGSATAQPELEVTGGKFKGYAAGGTSGDINANGVTGSCVLKGGIYSYSTNLSTYIPEGYEEVPLSEERPEYQSPENYRSEILEAGMHGIDVCKIGSTKYKTLEEALQVVKSGETIIMIANYTMATPGDYVLPAGATLLVPYSGQTAAKTTSLERVYGYTKPAANLKLSFGAGVNLDVLGTIEAGSKQAGSGQTGGYNGAPHLSYGWIYLAEGSTMTLENGAKLFAWGYVTGTGEIDAKRGSTVYEMFQLTDWRGGTAISGMEGNSKKVMPVNQYYIQNVECPIKFRPGAVELCEGSCNMSSDVYPVRGKNSSTSIQFIGITGSGSLFMMDDEDVSNDTWVRKSYDAVNDKQVYEINSSAKIGGISITCCDLPWIGSKTLSSTDYVMPITNNMKIHLLSGSMYITQNLELAAGAEIEVDKEATAYVNSGVSLYVFDTDEWDAFSGTTKTYPVRYTPSWTTCPRSSSNVPDAAINIHGKFVLNGNLYTTSSGANIFSTNEDAGTVTYNSNVSTSSATVYVCNNTSQTYNAKTCYPAWLQNGEGITPAYSETAGTAAGKTWSYYDDKWQCWTQSGCFTYDAQNNPYIKPAAYVQVTSNQPDANKLHHDAETGSRNFVWDENCYWWEVVTEPTAEGYYRSINADRNGKYNYYYYDSAAACWKIKKITVTWNINGSTTDYSVGYGTKPEWLGATPAKSSSSDNYVWRWDGWTMGSDPTVLANNNLPYVTENTTFTAHFYEKYYEYNITFKNSDGTILDSRNWRKGTTPSYEGTPTKNPTAAETYEFNGTWSPAITTVTGSATYTAQYTATPREYTITFLNYDMSKLGTAEVVYNGTPSNATYLEAVAPLTEDPYKPDNSAFSFEFAGWRLQGASSNGFAQVKGDQTYVAQFNQTTKKYKVSFVDDDETLLHWTQLEYGQTPSYTWADPADKQDVEWSYVFTGWDPAEFTTVEGPQTYTAVYNKTKRKYTITWIDGNDATLKTEQVAYGETPVYSGATPQKASTDAHSYVFNNTWLPAIVPVAGDASYTAQFNETERTYRVTWDAATNGGTCVTEYTDFSYNAAIGTLPVASKEGHTFNGWFTSASGGTQITAATKVTADVTYHAQFTINTHSLAWNANGGTLSGSYTSGTVTYGTTIAVPTVTRDGYIFDGWHDGTSKVDPASSMPDNDLTYTAQWTPAVASVAASGTPTTYHATVADAISAANGKTNAVVTMLQNASVASEITISAAMTIDLNGKTVSSTQANASTGVFKISASGKTVTINGTTGGTINHTANGSVFGIYVAAGSTLNMTGGTVIVDGGSGNPRGIYVRGASGSTATVSLTDVEVETKSTGNNSIAVYTYAYANVTIHSGTYTATAASSSARYAAFTRNESGSKITIEGGKFNGQDKDVHKGGTTATISISGGYYVHETNLAANCATNYHVLPLTGEDPYRYEVAEAYNITFKDGNNETIQSGYVKKGVTPSYTGSTPTKDQDAQYTYTFNNTWSPALAPVAGEQTYTAQFSSTPRTYTVKLNTNGGTINAGDVTEYTYGTGATLPNNVTKDGYEFGGWFDNDGLTGDAVTSISNTATGNKEYWAKWTQNIADRELDIVDWTSNSITINVTNLKAVGGTNKNNWKIYVNGKDYTRTSPECSTQSRTLTISGLSLTPNENLLIQLKNDADVIESQHNYIIPQIYNAENATLSGTTSSSVVYVYGGKLTISGNTTLAALYVCPGAEVEVNGGTLTVGKLVLRTKPWATAAISGNVTATNVYYTRIAPDGSVAYPTGQYYQFGLPYACAVSAVSLSDGTTPVYNSTWLLKSYNEEKRATNGATGENWDVLASSGTIAAGRGYEIFSSYKYYREYYFPVTPTENTSVAVTRHGEDKNNSGWNIVCSPLMSVYENKSNPVDGLKVSWLLADGYYDQAWPEVIWPALPFSYQASATGYLDFSSGDFNQTVSAPRRAAYKENIQTEWIHLDVKDGNGVGDHTSVFVHPDRFEATYQTGIDVAKQSFSASRALIYSSHAYGEMAFAGVADALLEQGVALTVYSPKEQELTISMRDNEWLDRMAYVWLIDNETGAQIDLLDSDYTFEAAAGTTTGRFILMGRFFAPQIATDIDEVDGEQAKARKIIIQDKMYILLNGQLYDATGKQVNKK